MHTNAMAGESHGRTAWTGDGGSGDLEQRDCRTAKAAVSRTPM